MIKMLNFIIFERAGHTKIAAEVPIPDMTRISEVFLKSAPETWYGIDDRDDGYRHCTFYFENGTADYRLEKFSPHYRIWEARLVSWADLAKQDV